MSLQPPNQQLHQKNCDVSPFSHLHALPNRNVEKKDPQSQWSPELLFRWSLEMGKVTRNGTPGAPAVSKVRSAATDQINFPQDRLGLGAKKNWAWFRIWQKSWFVLFRLSFFQIYSSFASRNSGRFSLIHLVIVDPNRMPFRGTLSPAAWQWCAHRKWLLIWRLKCYSASARCQYLVDFSSFMHLSSPTFWPKTKIAFSQVESHQGLISSKFAKISRP